MIFVTLVDFPSRILKWSIHRCIHSSWLAAFSLALEILFLLLNSFIIYHTILDRGARGVVVIAVGNEHGDTSSNPGRD